MAKNIDATSTSDAKSTSNMGLPGIDVALTHPHGLVTAGRRGWWHELALPITVRERVIMALTASIKNKPSWQLNVGGQGVPPVWMEVALRNSDGDSVAQNQDQQLDFDFHIAQAQAQIAALNFEERPGRQKVITEKLFQYVRLSATPGIRTS